MSEFATPAAERVEARTITGSRAKTALYLLISIIFVAVGAMLLRGPSASAMAWLCVAFFGLGVLLFAWLLIRPQTLDLDSEGFTLGGGMVRSPKKVLWREVEGFHVYRLPRGGKMIGYSYAPGPKKESAAVAFARDLGAESALPRGWPQSPEKMVDLLNAYRLRALGRMN
jgi:hypothetical protein